MIVIWTTYGREEDEDFTPMRLEEFTREVMLEEFKNFNFILISVNFP